MASYNSVSVKREPERTEADASATDICMLLSVPVLCRLSLCVSRLDRHAEQQRVHQTVVLQLEDHATGTVKVKVVAPCKTQR